MSVPLTCSPSTLLCPLWPYAGRIYGHPGLALHLLRCQDESGVWINDWLFALWQAGKGNILVPDYGVQLGDWQAWRTDILVPWRRWRRQLKGSEAEHSGLYQRAKDAELALEWHDQQRLCAWVSRLVVTDPDPHRRLEERLLLSLQRIAVGSSWSLTDSASLLSEAASAVGSASS